MSLSASIFLSDSPTAPSADRKTLILPHAPSFLLIENQQRHPGQRSR